MTTRNIVVSSARGPHVEQLPVEIVERKGIGHPDSICDGIAERISVEYTRWCQENLGAPLHHNFDKVQLVAGETDVRYGHGQLIKPIRIQIAGRGTPVTPDGRMVPMDAIAIKAAKTHIRETLKYLDPDVHCVIDSYAGRGASELIHAVDQITSNDTSFGCAHWPRSGLERSVYETAQYINYDLLEQFPIGEDVKVMGARFGGQIVLTCAIPFIAPQVADAAAYIEAKKAVHQAVEAFAKDIDSRVARVDVNTADEDGTDNVYLTLTGTSAEQGDDGSVGRGNRVTGVITPFRAASLEAAAGKNPISHVGKLYNVLSLEAARDIVESVEEVKEAQVYILSQIGKPLDQPLIATATVHDQDDGEISETARAKVESILDKHLGDMVGLREKMAKMEVSLY
ncbi:MAG: methionine adenosyltransferase [Chloroflexi bacterium]|nr:methionine adenosyltransferase [Chloroflexota bacterium]